MFHDPIRTVFISTFGSLFLIVSIVFCKYVYPKKDIKLFTLFILISLLPLLSLLRPGDYESGDFNIHLYRIIAFYNVLKEGIFMPSWAVDLNATYGNPLFIFNYSLPYYGVSFFHFLGISFISSMKIYLGLSFFLSGIFMYKWIKQLTRHELGAFAGGIFYLFNPYHLIDFHFRATLGEMSVFTIAPLVLLYVTKYFQQKKFHHLVLIGLTTIFMSLAHPLLAIAVIGLIFAFSMFVGLLKKQGRIIFHICVFLVIAAAASLYLWMPFILYRDYMFPEPSKVLNFNPFFQLFYSPWRHGFLFQGPQGELALFLGYSQIFIIVASLFLLLFHKVSRQNIANYLFWLTMFFLLLFLMSPVSFFIWKFFPLLWMFIPTGRLLLPTALCTSVLASYFVISFSNTKPKKYFVSFLLFFTIASTILNWGHRTVLPEIDDSYLTKNVWRSTVTETLTAYFLNNKWADINNFWFSELPRQHLEIIKGKGTVKQVKRTSIFHSYVINAETPIVIKENTLFFPGWKLTSNDLQVSIYPGKRGVISARLGKGLQYVTLSYEDIRPYKLMKIISVGITLTLFLLLIVHRLKPKIFKR